MSDDLKGKVAVITGGNRGLGKAMALALSKAGADVALIARDRVLLDSTAAEIRHTGGNCEGFVGDVTDEAAVQAAEKEIHAKFGSAHILTNNAGINIRKPLAEYALEEWRRVLDTNLTAAFLCTRAFIPHLQHHKWGRILNMTSMMSHVSLPGRAAYSASKAGLLGMTRALALELAPDGITVNGISPGPFATEMNTPVMGNPDTNKFFVERIPLGGWGKVEDIGELAVFLCSERARFITGTDIVIDGGWTAQ